MTKNQVNNFRNALEARVIEFRRSTMQRDAIRIEATSDEIDRTSGACDREMAGRTLEANSQRLREAQAALTRITDGTYGLCRDCDEPISAKRLAAMPWAKLCIRCQEDDDRRRPCAA
jgi:DnaK suppressor protein